MKTYLRFFNRIIKIFPDDSFYTCSVDNFGCAFQGKYSPETILFAQKLKFTVTEITVSGYIELKRKKLKITLTN